MTYRSANRLHGSGPEPFEACPDGGRCWHGCPLMDATAKHPEGRGVPCARVSMASPLGRDEWTPAERAEHDPDVEALDVAILDTAATGTETTTTTEWAVHGDGYDHERRHHDDAVDIVAMNPEARTLMHRTVITVTTPWTVHP